MPLVLSAIAGTFLAWFTTSYFLNKWKSWAFKRDTSPERLYRLGKPGLINTARYKIFLRKKKQKSDI
ncbi:MAG: hypothetical protein K2X86_06845 [Cytophagaceae bacterium]|nr:hypothetical protein [Cytophagaceae bacterium]